MVLKGWIVALKDVVVDTDKVEQVRKKAVPVASKKPHLKSAAFWRRKGPKLELKPQLQRVRPWSFGGPRLVENWAT